MINWKLVCNRPTGAGGGGIMSDEKFNKMVDNAESIVSECMNYFCSRLNEIENWTIDDSKRIFKEIIDDLPILTFQEWNGKFSIRYNSYISIEFEDTLTQIYREQKLNKLL
jgi:hypothetical protein